MRRRVEEASGGGGGTTDARRCFDDDDDPDADVLVRVVEDEVENGIADSAILKIPIAKTNARHHDFNKRCLMVTCERRDGFCFAIQ